MKAFYTYQKERFPLFVNLVLIGAFTISAMSFSKNIRGEKYTIDWKIFLVGLAITFTTFFLIRIIDEFKDYDTDKVNRPHLPVQRGVISLNQLKIIGVLLFAIQIILMATVLSKLWLFYIIMMGYLFLMSFEFFIPEWLNRHTIIYTLSHMVIVALIDLFATTLDWGMLGIEVPKGLLILVLVSFFNGLVIEFGRKIKAPENEDYNSYTKLYGTTKSTFIWITIMLLTLISATVASLFAGYPPLSYLILSFIFIISLSIGIAFINHPTKKKSKLIEAMSAIWTLTMYLVVGCFPQIYGFVQNIV